ncbi:hypothetical protein Droror1_Dr00017460 [Drosera rotundifolia]
MRPKFNQQHKRQRYSHRNKHILQIQALNILPKITFSYTLLQIRIEGNVISYQPKIHRQHSEKKKKKKQKALLILIQHHHQTPSSSSSSSSSSMVDRCLP